MVIQLHPVAKKVVELLEPHIERQGYELVAVEYKQGRRTGMLRLLIDRHQGRIALGELEGLSHLLGDLLDVYDPVEGRYILEVASPGINRPLVKLSHFKAHAGQRVRVRTVAPREGQKTFTGVMAAVNEGGIEVEDEISRRRQIIGFDEISSANYEHKFD